MSHLLCFFSLEDTYFHFVPSLTNYQTTLVAACLLPKPVLPAVADPEANGRAHSHNTVTFREWPLVAHGSGLHIPHLSECKVRVAIFIERNRVGGMWDSAHLYAPLHLRCSVRIINLSLETFSFAVLTQINDKY